MVRPPLSPEERARGERLGTLLREARGRRSMAEIAAASGVPAETLRKIETGRIATPAFFTVAALATALGISMEEIARRCAAAPPAEPLTALPAAPLIAATGAPVTTKLHSDKSDDPRDGGNFGSYTAHDPPRSWALLHVWLVLVHGEATHLLRNG